MTASNAYKVANGGIIPGKIRFARRFFYPYYTKPPSEMEIILRETLYIRVTKPVNGKGNGERIRMRGKVSLGGGILHFNLKSGQGFSVQRIIWTINVGMIKKIEYEEDSKSFTLNFHESQNKLTLMFTSCKKSKNWLRTLFVELRVQAQLFNNLLRRLLPSPWKKVLRFEMVDGLLTSVVLRNGRSPVEALNHEERKGLNMKDEGLVMVDTCLREEVDLWTLARGDSHPDVAEACERLSIWLLAVSKQEESDYWYEEARNIRHRFTKKMQNEVGPTMNPGYQSTNFAVENIRNPPGMLTGSIFIKNKEDASTIDRTEKADYLLSHFKKALFGKESVEFSRGTSIDNFV